MYKSGLFFTCGNARSGKSTYCNEWKKELNRVVVCADNVRLALTGQRYCRLAETCVFNICHVSIRSLLLSGYDVCFDDTNTSEISIQRMLEIDIDATPIFIDTNPNICIQRAIDTNQEDLIPAIKRTSENIRKIKEAGGIEIFIKNILAKMEK